jgi:hypothetical protein
LKEIQFPFVIDMLQFCQPLNGNFHPVCGLTLSVHTLRFSAFSAQQWQGLTSGCRISLAS